MPIKTAEDLQDILQEEIAWRKKEIGIAFTAASNSNKTDEIALFRAFWLLQYAHWEGFVKIACEKYLEFVAYKRLKYSQLQPGFRLLPNSPLRKALKTLIAGNSNEIEVLSNVDSVGEKRFSKRKFDVSTGGNLRFRLLNDFSTMTCVDLSSFVDENKLDTVLADRRNEIAHGRWIVITKEDAELIRDDCLSWMDQILNNLVNAALMNKFRI